MPGLNDFLPTLARDFLIGLGGFTVFLLVIRLLPDFARNLTLLLASLAAIEVFTSPFYTFGLVAVTGVTYYALFWLQWSERKRILCLGISLFLLALFFLLKDVPRLETPWTGPRVHLFGVTWLAIRLLAVARAVGRGKQLPSDPLEFFVYIFFFPTFFVGPYTTLEDFRKNLTEENRPMLSVGETGSHLIRIAVGFAKGWMVWRFLIWQPDAIVSGLRSFEIVPTLSAAAGMYLGLSAMADVVIGATALAGYRLAENFDYPYFRPNPQAFWRSWVAPVYGFLREELYLPLGGATHRSRNAFFVFLAAGLGVRLGLGAVLWAAWNAAGLWATALGKGKVRIPSALGAVFNAVFVMIGWVLLFV